MNKSTELGIIDYSILTTMGKKGDYSSYENVVGALENYVFQDNPMGFTRKDNARDYIKSLSKDDIKKELVKNIVKKHCCAEQNGYATLLNTDKKFVDELTISEAELLIFKTISSPNTTMYEFDDILNKLPKLTTLMIESFVDSRYFDRSYMVTNLDSNELLTPDCQNLLFKIETFYLEKQNNKDNNLRVIS